MSCNQNCRTENMSNFGQFQLNYKLRRNISVVEKKKKVSLTLLINREAVLRANLEL